MLTLVAAMAHDRVIGHDGKMPWHLPHEFKHFKAVTIGKPVIMGRTTYESLPQLLPQRDNIIISRQPDLQVPGATVYHSIEQALTIAQQTDEIMIIGGGKRGSGGRVSERDGECARRVRERRRWLHALNARMLNVHQVKPYVTRRKFDFEKTI